MGTLNVDMSTLAADRADQAAQGDQADRAATKSQMRTRGGDTLILGSHHFAAQIS
jgi:hypothetical protein